MDRYTETFRTWNKVASEYEEKFMNLDLYSDTYDYICHSISKDKAEILEIGCGPGNITKYLLAKRPAYNIFGIDIAPNMIELARRNNPTASFLVMDCREISKLNTKYDGVICGFCIPYLSQDDCAKLIADCSGLLNANGLIYLSFVEGDLKKSGFQVGSSGDRCYFYYHTLSTVKNQLIENGFDIIKKFEVNYIETDARVKVHTILIARKKKTS